MKGNSGHFLKQAQDSSSLIFKKAHSSLDLPSSTFTRKKLEIEGGEREILAGSGSKLELCSGLSSQLWSDFQKIGTWTCSGASLLWDQSISYMWKSGWVTESPAKKGRSPRNLEKASSLESRPLM